MAPTNVYTSLNSTTSTPRSSTSAEKPMSVQSDSSVTSRRGMAKDAMKKGAKYIAQKAKEHHEGVNAAYAAYYGQNVRA